MQLSLFLPQAAGFPEPEIIHYNPKEFDFGKKKAFPFRDQVNQMHNLQFHYWLHDLLLWKIIHILSSKGIGRVLIIRFGRKFICEYKHP